MTKIEFDPAEATSDQNVIFKKAVTVAGLCSALYSAIEDLNWGLFMKMAVT
jgi:hypothetical protein